MKSPLACNLLSFAAVMTAVVPSLAQAQSLPYGDMTGGGSSASRGSQEADSGEEGDDADTPRRSGKQRVKITPYIEAQQVAFAELKPGNETLTYSVLAAGVDAALGGRNNQGSISVRYERRFGWGSKAQDSNAVSGIARVSSAVVPGTLKIDAGAMAARNAVENNGALSSGGLAFGDSVTQIYSVYAGPTLTTRAGDVAINGAYRIGYNRVESPNVIPVAAGQPQIDLFDDSVVHNATIHAGTKAGDLLPVGLGVGAGYNREDISNLKQRVEDFHARADATLPLGNDLSLVGGVGWEKVQISSKDAVRDPITGAAVVGTDGRYVTDNASPRQMAYDVEGLIWDAGVMWRPSRRTALEAHVGRRYGSTTYYGSFAYAPNSRTSMNVSVYDTISGFGGQLNNALANTPTQFQAVRNPFNGNLNTCVAADGAVGSGQSPCIGSALASVRSSVFRSRGVMASYNHAGDRIQYGIGGGYDRRKFIGAPGTVLAAANGVIDENYWLSAYLSGRIDRASSFSTNVYANWYQPGDAAIGDMRGVGATAAYYRSITSHLSATAAVGLDGVSREQLDDIWSTQAMVGVRYSF
ncbi:preprotein translocase subunit YajC [Novosphingobium sp. B 225]|uniref:preprotein translocase subunit YajC n=1 Tax=Novosphingobium sp. B 225 TaxID=1961849 RepID=UPI000B4BE90B|nr:preprotein translocase subunit YajC [Novosphingobium sp. B 225]